MPLGYFFMANWKKIVLIVLLLAGCPLQIGPCR